MPTSKVMNYNTRERAVSNDFNRAQTFLAADVAELLRHSWIGRTSEAEAGGIAVVEATQTTPMTALILNGLMCLPEVAGTALSVTAGSMMAIDPTGDGADDSPCKLVKDPGSTGSLTFLANAGPGRRIDVVEVSIVHSTLESDNRDIYNPATGTFTPTSVVKVKAPRLSYRVRRGTQGAGYPGSAAGWLPLMIASVPSGAASWDDCACWDVRPLYADRMEAGNYYRVQASNQTQDARVTVGFTTGLGTLMHGKIEKRYRTWLAGGRSPIAGFDLLVQRASASFTPIEIAHLYALFPHGLPRWCEYDAPSGGVRIPGAFRGILTVASIDPDELSGAPSGGVALPSVTGLTGTTTEGVHMLSGRWLAAVNTILGTTVNGDVTRTMAQAPTIAGTLIAGDPDVFDFALVHGGYYPANARSLIVEIVYTVTATGAVEGLHDVRASVSNRPGDADEWALSNKVTCDLKTNLLKLTGAGTGAFSYMIEIPAPSKYPTSLSSELRVEVGRLANMTVTACEINIRGWRH